ncbi:MAG: hypothetical protein CR972_04275 [Candidatus Moraniibacteriota bacterium]|nr:MAG: hypothetical protein CR972_04275 [Candidatus Moranbacteria bacterium]
MGGAEGINSKKVRTLDLILALLVTGSGALFFLFVSRSISGVAYSTWIVPIIAVTIFTALLSVFAFTSSVKKIAMPIAIIAFLPSIIFMPVLTHMSVTIVMMIIAIHGLYVMRRTLFNTLRIDVGTIVRSGSAYVSIALVVIVSSQYYFSLKEGEVDIIFDATEHVEMSNMFANLILTQSNINNVSMDTMTVDDFLMFLAKNAYTEEQKGNVIPVESEGMIVRWANNAGMDLEKIEDNAQEMVVEQMRTNLSEVLGYELTGKEEMIEVFSEIIENQVNTIMTQNEILRTYKAEIFSALFFLILFSFASVIRVLSNFLARFIFMILRETKIIKIANVQRDVEVIKM